MWVDSNQNDIRVTASTALKGHATRQITNGLYGWNVGPLERNERWDPHAGTIDTIYFIFPWSILPANGVAYKFQGGHWFVPQHIMLCVRTCMRWKFSFIYKSIYASITASGWWWDKRGFLLVGKCTDLIQEWGLMFIPHIYVGCGVLAMDMGNLAFMNGI